MRRLMAVGLSAAFVLVLLVPTVAWAASPSNDAFENATVVDDPDTTHTYTVDLSTATVETGEPVTCPNQVLTSAQSIWYRLTAPVTGAVVARVTASSTTDYRLATYRDTGGGIAGLSLVYCRGVGGPTATARVTGGSTYYVQIAGIGAGPGSITFDINFYRPPANDSFSGATPVGELPWTGTVQQYAATVETGEPNQCGLTNWTDRRSVWYRLDASSDGQITVETAADIVGAEARVVPFPAGGTGWNGTTTGACGTSPASTFTVQAGRTYFVQVVNYFGQGTVTVRFAFAPSGPPSNDAFADAMPITGPSFSDKVDTTRATGEPGEPPQCGGSSVATLWYSFVAAESGRLAIWATGPSAESGLFAPYLATGGGFAGLQSLGCGTGSAGIAIGVEAGSTYYIQAGFIGPYGYPVPGTYTLNASFTPNPPPPANDAFADAVAASSLPFVASVDTRGATREADEPAICGSSRTVWYSYHASEAATLVVDTSGSGFMDSSAAVYRADGAGLAGLSFIACAWFGGPAKIEVEAGRDYYIQGGDYGWVNGGVLRVGIDLAPPPPPAPSNDDLARATLVSGSSFTDTVDNRGATIEADEPHGCSVSLWRTVWYKISPATAGTLTVTPAAGTVTDSDLALYRALGPGFAGLDYRACSYHDPLTYRLEAGGTYYLQVYDAYLGGGTFHLDFTFIPDPDKIAPDVSYSPHPASYALNEPVQIACTATDDVGVVSTTCAHISAIAWELGLGTHEYSATATDAAGNVGTGSTSFDVVATYPSMVDLTRQWFTRAGIADDLVAKLTAAQRAEARGNTKSETAILDDYRALLRAQAGKSIAPADAERLISFSFGL